MALLDHSPDPPPEHGLWHTTHISGNCSGCHQVIRPGDIIRHDGLGGYLCTECGDTGPGLRTVRVLGELLLCRGGDGW
jgi:hypothetical protein